MKIRFIFVTVFALSFGLSAKASFQAAKPVWPAGREKEMNLLAGFRAVFEAPENCRAVLRITASSVYRAFVNGEFAGHGPARGPHGYFRVDEWDLTGRLRSGKNLVAVEVAGYNVNSYYLLNQPSFLQAEVVSEGRVLASTAGQGAPFEARILTERIQKAERYSFQRTFSEAYRITAGYDSWRKSETAPFAPVTTDVVPAGKLLPRRVPYPDFGRRQPAGLASAGEVQTRPLPKQAWKGRARGASFSEAELGIDASLEIQKLMSRPRLDSGRALSGPVAMTFEPNSYRIFDFGTNLTGFIGLRVSCPAGARIFLAFDEILTGGDVDFKRLGALSVVTLDLGSGTHDFETVEPYTLRYLKLIAVGGGCRIENLYLREYTNPNVWRAHFSSSDPRLRRLFDAGRETFRQNAVDIFMDCPQRERAGWLCDSFFTARVEPDLGGETLVEKAFLENFLLPESYPALPKCMLPMCYPGDHPNGRFIPNWAMWFVLELEEYLARTGDREMVDAFRPKVMCLLDYFKQFRNADGLLERLPSWVFIEWSAANKFVQDVNYPSNMLYAAAIAAAGRIYGEPGLAAEAARIRGVIRKQSFDGEFFVDNAERRNGRLELTRNRTEVCQYFAFYFETATPESHAKLWSVLRDRFGPDRAARGGFPEIHAANSFIGNMLRAELLSRYGLAQQLLDESIAYLLYMAERTGTLWENVDPGASCNHGFASHIVHTLYRDVLGVRQIDRVSKTVRVRFTDLRLEWCEGEIPVGTGRVVLRWRKLRDSIRYRAEAPAGYRIEIENLSGKDLIIDN